MDWPIIVVDADKTESRDLCTALERDNYLTVAIHSLANLEEKIQETGCRIVILDLDTLPVDNRFIMDLRKGNPALAIIGLSTSPFHPELEAAMSSSICACLGKPPDLDELSYFIRSFSQEGVTSKEGEGD